MSEPAIPGHLTGDDLELDDRQRRVFAALLAVHGRTARPVGSETLARIPGVNLSPASIRTTLAELEARGLLERAHASAGRVPTASGYAYHVRALRMPVTASPELMAAIDRALSTRALDVERLLHDACRLLASLTDQLGLALTASLEQEPLVGLDLDPIDARRAVLVLGLGAGAVHTLKLALASPLERGDLASVEAVLRERLLGRPLGEVRARLSADPELVRDSAVRIVASAAARSWAQPASTAFYAAGASRIAELPEFQHPSQLTPVLRVVEQGNPLERLMVATAEGQVAVRVGIEGEQGLAGVSLVSYALPGSLRAAVGVLGPMRMDYVRVLAVVDAVGARITDLIA
jgi:heat-inducible transcriptional repressor